MGVVRHFQALLLNSRGDKTLLKFLAQEVQRSGCSPNLLLYKDPKQEMPHLLNLPLRYHLWWTVNHHWVCFTQQCAVLHLSMLRYDGHLVEHKLPDVFTLSHHHTSGICLMKRESMRELTWELIFASHTHAALSTNRSSRTQLISLLAGGASSLPKPKQCNLILPSTHGKKQSREGTKSSWTESAALQILNSLPPSILRLSHTLFIF